MGVSGRVMVLWVSGLTWEMLENLPAMAALQARGAAVTSLRPAPITGPKTQAWQVMSGQNPGQAGYFDVWLPRQYAAQPVSEPAASCLREALTAAGHTDRWIDLPLADVPTLLNESSSSVDCLVMRATAGDDLAALEQAIAAARASIGADDALFLLSDHQPAAVKGYVNLNDALRALDVLEVSAENTIRWEATLAYHAGHGQLWINLAGREPTGTIASGTEYDQTCQALIRSLPAKLLDPRSGEPVVEQVYTRNEVYQGDYLFRAPDLVVVLRPGYAPSPNSVAVGLDGAAVWPAPAGTRAVSGLHPTTVAGLAVALGAPFAPGRVIAQAPLMNIAPTILHALRLPIPAKMDAEVIADLFAPAFLEQHPIQRSASGSELSAEDEEEILARLKSLGYLG